MPQITRRRLLQQSAACLAAVPLARAEAGPLFNGRDLSGWTHRVFGLWTVENGEIVARFDPAHVGPGYLLTERTFRDFTLELDFWVSKQGNSGVYVRQPLREFGPRGDERPAQRPDDGVEVQIDYNDPKNYTGAIYNKQKPARVVGGEDRWNHYRIQCAGTRVQVWIDRELVNDYSGLRSPEGAIGMQMHGNKLHDHVVKFRNIRLV